MAVEQFLKVLKINPRDEIVRHKLIQTYLEERRYDLAKEETYKLLAINPSSIAANHELGDFYYREGKYSQALTQFQKVLGLYLKRDYTQEELGDVYISIGRTYIPMEEYNMAIEYLKKAKELKPQDRKIHRLLSSAYLGVREHESAVDVIAEDYPQISVKPRYFSVKIKIVRIPNFYGSEILSTEMNSIMIPPLALGSLVSYIRSQAIPIDQDDLHIKIHYDNYFGNAQERIDESVFFDISRAVRYTQGDDDIEIEDIMEKVCRKTDFQGYKIVLFSLDSCSINDSHALFAICLARYLKKKYNPIIILGGLNYFVELMHKIGCSRSDIDYVICNEGEKVITELLLSLLNSQPYEGTGRQEGNGVIYAQNVPPPVRPDFDGLPLDKYRYRGLNIDYCRDGSLKDIVKKFNESKAFLLPIKFIKGCTNRCIFCASSAGGLIHVVSPSSVADWLQEVQTRYNPTGYLFLNDTLNISKKYIDKLCDEIIKRKLKILWSDCARVDRLDEESVNKMKEAGCIRLVFGMETASKRLLRYINKDIDLKQLEEVLCWTDRAGIWTGIEIIGGLPYEKEEDVEETISFLRQNREHIDAFYYNAFNIKDTSSIRLYPEKYGITNIFELSSYEDGFGTFVKYGFDEIDGLKWPEKRKQIISSIYKVVRNFGDSSFPAHEYEAFLFFLYSNYTDKKSIRNIFYSAGREKVQYLNSLLKGKYKERQGREPLGETLIYG